MTLSIAARVSIVALVGWLATQSPVLARQPPRSGARLLTPTAGAPASLEAGTTLTVHVALSTALTPPPGIQQPRALRDWSAELVAFATESGKPVRYRYVLAVTNVRAESGTTLQYRAEVPMPAWIAPGRYAVLLHTPAGVAHGADAVHITRDGQLPNQRPLVVPLGTRLPLPTGVAGSWFPGASLGAPQQEPVVVGWVPDATLDAHVPTNERGTKPLVITTDRRPVAGQEVTLSADRAVPPHQLAWTVIDGPTAYGTSTLTLRLPSAGPLRGTVMVIAPDGSAVVQDFRVQVTPGLRFGCAVGGPGARDGSGWLDALLLGPLLLALWLLKRRPPGRWGINCARRSVGDPARCTRSSTVP